jgi:hypothetical protein
MVRDVVTWWSGVLGVVDPQSIELAMSIIVAGSFLLLAFYLVAAVFAFVLGFFT